jgi:cell division protein FtsQ
MKLYLKILIGLLWVGLLAGSVLLMGFANNLHRDQYCKGVEVDIIHQGDELITTALVKEQMKTRFGNINKKLLRDIDVEEITSFLKKNPFVEKTNVKLNVDGLLSIQIAQRRPVLRVFNSLSQQYYIDSKGNMLPVNNEYPAHVVVASGNIGVPLKVGHNIYKGNDSTRFSAGSLISAFHVAKVISADSLASAVIEQIYIDGSGSIKLISKAGQHLIFLGDTLNTKEKLDNLFNFYRFGLTKTGWDKYHVLDLRFKNQVVCKK